MSGKLSENATITRSIRRIRRHVSPLRYPGGKASLSGFLTETIELNGLVGCSYYEPFAGGAGAALRLLMEDVVSEVHLNDVDPRIFAFWNAALCDTERFVDAILTTPVTIEEWYKQRAICQGGLANGGFELGFATFYLNRCNRSGVISGAAPMGGFAQLGQWKIDARFHRTRLADRIQNLSNYADRIHVSDLDAHEFLVGIFPPDRRLDECFAYLDPPYYGQGNRLYFNTYDDEGHEMIADSMVRQNVLPWLISYDDSEFIRRLYRSCQVSDLSVRYSLQTKRRARELLIAPPHVRLPVDRENTRDPNTKN